MRPGKTWHVWLATLALVGGAFPGNATVLTFVDERDLVREANLVFQGRVTKIESRLSDRRDVDDAALPHTFVTFRIERLLKGNSAAGDRVTLRFEGGPFRDGRYLHLVGAPVFRVGERDVVFVAGNGVRWCPVVGWTQGRFRVVDDQVFSDGGLEIWLNPDGRLAYGAVNPEVREAAQRVTDRISLHELPARTFSKALPNIEPAPGSRRLDAEGFAAVVSELAARSHSSGELVRLPPVASADMRERFYARPAVDSPPPAIPPKAPAVEKGEEVKP